MNNPIDQIIGDVLDGSTFLFNQAVEYLLTLDDDLIPTEGKNASKKLAKHFPAMGLFSDFGLL